MCALVFYFSSYQFVLFSCFRFARTEVPIYSRFDMRCSFIVVIIWNAVLPFAHCRFSINPSR